MPDNKDTYTTNPFENTPEPEKEMDIETVMRLFGESAEKEEPENERSAAVDTHNTDTPKEEKPAGEEQEETKDVRQEPERASAGSTIRDESLENSEDAKEPFTTRLKATAKEFQKKVRSLRPVKDEEERDTEFEDLYREYEEAMASAGITSLTEEMSDEERAKRMLENVRNAQVPFDVNADGEYLNVHPSSYKSPFEEKDTKGLVIRIDGKVATLDEYYAFAIRHKDEFISTYRDKYEPKILRDMGWSEAKINLLYTVRNRFEHEESHKYETKATDANIRAEESAKQSNEKANIPEDPILRANCKMCFDEIKSTLTDIGPDGGYYGRTYKEPAMSISFSCTDSGMKYRINGVEVPENSMLNQLYHIGAGNGGEYRLQNISNDMRTYKMCEEITKEAKTHEKGFSTGISMSFQDKEGKSHTVEFDKEFTHNIKKIYESFKLNKYLQTMMLREGVGFFKRQTLGAQEKAAAEVARI